MMTKLEMSISGAAKRWMRRPSGRKTISGSPGDPVVIDFKARAQPTKF